MGILILPVLSAIVTSAADASEIPKVAVSRRPSAFGETSDESTVKPSSVLLMSTGTVACACRPTASRAVRRMV